MTENLLSGVLIALQDRHLLLPHNLIAEVTAMDSLIVESHNEDWILGHMYWRHKRIPVVCFEKLSGGSLKKHSENARIAVFNRSSEHEQLSFWGMLVQGQPAAVQVAEDDLQGVGAELSQAEILAVRLEGKQASIPDLTFVENQLLSSGVFN